MPHVYCNVPAGQPEALGQLAERDLDGNRSAVIRDAIGRYLTGHPAP